MELTLSPELFLTELHAQGRRATLSRVLCRFDSETPWSLSGGEFTSPTDELVAWDISEVVPVLLAAQEAVAKGHYAAGFVAYDAAPAFDASLSVRQATTSAKIARLPLVWFGIFDDARSSTPPQAPSSARRASQSRLGGRVSDWSCEMSQGDHAAAIDSIRSAISAGDTYLVNLTARLRRCWRTTENPLDLYQQLISGTQGQFHAFLDTADWAVACASPELFFELNANELTTRPMKGTAPRGRWYEEDIGYAERLAASAKERAENVMVVDLIRNDLSRIAALGSVKVPTLWDVERHPTVWQLTSTVTAVPKTGVRITDIFRALFPSGSVTGAPKRSTMGVIADLERSPRGVYCGAVGLLWPGTRSTANPEGVMARFAVAIRTAVIDKRHHLVEYGSGGGITWDSEPSAEWEELLLKTNALRDTPSRVETIRALLETMRFEPGSATDANHGIHNLPGHLARLEKSASYFGFRNDPSIEQKLVAAVIDETQPSRLRLLLARNGDVTIDLSPLSLEPSRGEIRKLCVDPEPVDSSDPYLFHKTTNRDRYKSRAARHAHSHDVILVNERGEVTETTIGNLAVQLEGRWWTPPLDCGLLPGVERSRLLAEGVLAERRLTLEQLWKATAIATISSLRGWRLAQLRSRCYCTQGENLS